DFASSTDRRRTAEGAAERDVAVNGMMMDFPLTLPVILRRAEQHFGHKEIVTRRPDRSLHRYTYADFARRTKKLAVALNALGLTPRNLRLEPPPAPRDLLRRPEGWRGGPHAEHPPAPQRPDLHRQPRQGPRRHRRQDPAAGVRAIPIERRRAARDLCLRGRRG